MKQEIKESDCNFTLLVDLPNGKTHYVIISQENLRMAIRMEGKFAVMEEPLQDKIVPAS